MKTLIFLNISKIVFFELEQDLKLDFFVKCFHSFHDLTQADSLSYPYINISATMEEQHKQQNKSMNTCTVQPE